MNRLSIANVVYSLIGPLDTSLFDTSYEEFWVEDDSAAAFKCEIYCNGSDGGIASLPLNLIEPWSFRANEENFEIIRRNRAGESIWRIEAPLSFHKAFVSWNPEVFAKHYDSYEKSWNTGLGLALVIMSLIRREGLLFHGAAAVLDGDGVLFVGVSGRGKSTISRLLNKCGAHVLTDERPVVRNTHVFWGGHSGSGFHVYGSPWPSSAGYASNSNAVLKKIYFLEHGLQNQITPISTADAFSRLIYVAMIPWQDPEIFDPCLKTVESLLANVPAAVLSFKPDEAVVETIRQDLAAERDVICTP